MSVDSADEAEAKRGDYRLAILLANTWSNQLIRSAVSTG